MKYDKLVRDKIPDSIVKNGKTPVTHIANDDEYLSALVKKLHEEVAEYVEDGNIEELADILEVVYALSTVHKLSIEDLEFLRVQKLEKRGGFDQKIILEKTN